MLIPFILTLLNGWLSNEMLTRGLYVNVGGFPINVMDFMLLLGAVTALFVRSRPEYRSPGVHPLLVLTITLFFVGAAGGLIRAFTGPYTIDEFWIARCVRHYVTIPLTIVLGYTLIRTPRGAGFYVAGNVLAGIGAAVLVGLFFGNKSEDLGGVDAKNINILRTVQYNVTYSGIGVGVVLFILFNRLRYLRGAAGWATIFASAGGVFLTLSRSDWLATVAGVLPVFLAAPRGERAKRAVQGVAAALILAIAVGVMITVAGSLLGGDFSQKMRTRVDTMNPFKETLGREGKAWDSRLPGIEMELAMWSANPVLGMGFGSQYAVLFTMPDAPAMRHNAFTSIMSETGTVGLIPVLIMFGGMFVLGRRLVRLRFDRISVLVGMTALVVASLDLAKGMMTMSWNNEREGMILGFTFGVLLRAVQMQKAMQAWQAGYLSEPTAEGYAFDPDAGVYAPQDQLPAWRGSGAFDGFVAR